MSTYTKLATTTVGAGGASSVTFSGITQGYTDLKIVFSARSNKASAYYDSMVLTPNGGTTPSYKILYGNSSTAASFSGSDGYIGDAPAASVTASTFGSGEIYITNYASNTAYKSFSVDNVLENNSSTANQAYIEMFAELWSNTNPITSLVISAAAGSFIQYSTFTLYGVYSGAEVASISAPTIGTATAGDASATVAFTPPATTSNIASYVATSSPGSITGYGTASPISVSGLTNGTAYTFTVAGVNPQGTGAASAASNSVTPVGTAFESIATVNVGAGGSSTITFSSIPSTYKHLQLRLIWKDGSAGGNQPYLRMNSDSGTNYTRHVIFGDGSSVTAGGASTSAGYTGVTLGYIASNATNVFPAAIADILDYADTNKYKTVRYIAGNDRNGAGDITFGSSLWLNTSAISTLTIVDTGGINFSQYSSFALYGIKGA